MRKNDAKKMLNGDELRRIFTDSSLAEIIYAGIDESDIKNRYEAAYKALLRAEKFGIKIEPMPKSPKELSDPTEDDLFKVEVSIGIDMAFLDGIMRELLTETVLSDIF